jgi:hypothetical protein
VTGKGTCYERSILCSPNRGYRHAGGLGDLGMSLNCTRCEGTGFINLHQVEDETLKKFDESGDVQVILDWIAAHGEHDVSVCDCCGNCETWGYEPGRHSGYESVIQCW